MSQRTLRAYCAWPGVLLFTRIHSRTAGKCYTQPHILTISSLIEQSNKPLFFALTHPNTQVHSNLYPPDVLRVCVCECECMSGFGFADPWCYNPAASLKSTTSLNFSVEALGRVKTRRESRETMRAWCFEYVFAAVR